MKEHDNEIMIEMQPKPPLSPLSVSHLTQQIKANLENSFRTLYVQGEISNYRRQSSGHLYFSLKDSSAQISCVMFRGSTTTLKQEPKVGDQVIIQGELNVYAPRGNYQIIVRTLEQAGLGALLLEFEKLKTKLKTAGYFDPEKKQPLPKYPKIIGLVTSPTGAAIQDMLHILRRRAAGFHVRLLPVKVQGEGSAQEIAEAIDLFNKHQLADVLIVGRGGGSMEDLWAFNEECVAEAIHKSLIPVISAVGHETDITLSDFVADVRAPTPSAAAEIVLGETSQKLKLLSEWQRRLDQWLLPRLKEHRRLLERIKQTPFLRSPLKILEPYWQHLDDLKTELDESIKYKISSAQKELHSYAKQLEALNPGQKISAYKKNLYLLTRQLDTAIFTKIDRSKEKKKHLQEILNSLDPKNLLQKGYSILFSEKDHSVILSAEDIKPGDQVDIQFGKGRARATINQTFSK